MLDLTFSALVLHRAIYAAAELKIADLLAGDAGADRRKELQGHK